MVDIRLGVRGLPDDFVAGGDGEELLFDTFDIIGSIYGGLIRHCEHCADLYKDILTDPDTLKELFDHVMEDYLNSEGEEYEMFYGDDDEEETEEEQEWNKSIDDLIFKAAKQTDQRKDALYGGKGLHGTSHIRRIK